MNMFFHPCLKCLIGLKVRIAVRQLGFDYVSEELDQDVKYIIANYVQTNYASDPVREYMYETLERQCSQKYL
jgi:hypothetical protein